MKNKLPWDLIVSKLRRELSAKNEKIFQDWLKIGDNEHLFQQLEIVWQNIQNKVETYEPDLDYYWKELSARINELDNVENKKFEKKQSRTIILKRFSQVAAVAGVLLATIFLGVYLGRNNSTEREKYITYSTLNSKSNFFLPDSTEVWLHNNSSLTYNFNKKSKQREVEFAGEAYFNVKHDATKSFLVTSNGVQIKVHGTQFNVNSKLASNKVLVSLYEGSVSMKIDDKNVFLRPGEEGLFDATNKAITVSEGDIEFAKIWTSDKIRFEDKNLREVCRYLAKWYGVKIDIDSEIKNDQSYTFTFRGQSLDDVVSIIASIHSFNYIINEENNTVLIKK